jgi:hypothetical protein
MNIMGGGGFEIWQHTQRTPLAPSFELQMGDLGIIAGKIKSNNVELAFEHLKDANELTEIVRDPKGRKTFFLKDPFNNIWQVVEEYSTFVNKHKPTGGSFGVIIGTTQPEKAMEL